MADELISRQAVLDMCKRQASIEWNQKAAPYSWSYAYEIFAENIEALPAVDAVEVVRCEDCDVPHNKWTGCPMLNGLVTPPDFYCGFGERREENAAD